MAKVPTYCRICEAACGLIADTDGDGLRLTPDPDHVVSRGFVCAKGVRFAQVHTDPDRVNTPLIREAGQLRAASWGRALKLTGDRLAQIRRDHGPHAVGMYIGNPAAFSPLTTLFGLGFVKALGTRNYFNAGSLDCNNKFVVAREMLGSPATHPIPELDSAMFALLIGTNPSVSQSSFINAPRMVERLREIEKRGGQVYVVDPRRTETARSVGRWMSIRPDTDAALLLGLVHVILAEGLEDAAYIKAHTAGLAELRQAAGRFTPAAVSRLTGVAAEHIRELARGFASARGAFCHVSTGVNQGRFGTIAYAAKIALEAITGNLDRSGGALLPKGALDTAGLAALFGADREPRWKSRIGGFSPVLGSLPCAILPDEILTEGAEKIRALVVLAGNPLLSAPDSARLLSAFKQLEFLVVIDLFVSDTGAHADVVLPATDWLEREDVPLAQLQLQPVPYVQWTPAVVAPRAERRHDWRILLDLARSSGIFLGGSRGLDEGLRAAVKLLGPRALLLAPLLPALGPGALRKLQENPHGILLKREQGGDFLRRRIRTKSRKIELCPPRVYALLPELQRAVSAGPTSDLLVFSKRQRLGHNSWLHNNPALNPGAQRAHLSPEDAARLGVKSGDWLRLEAESGAIELQVQLDPDVSPGGIAVPHGYGHEGASGWSVSQARGGQNVNTLAASGPKGADSLSGMCRFNGIAVAAHRVGAPRASSEAPDSARRGGLSRADTKFD